MSIESTRNGFYPLWPHIDGKNIQYQWGEIRSNTADTKAIVRGSIQDMESGVDELNALRACLGQEYGDLDFKSKWSVFYNKSTKEYTIRKNTGTVDIPVWEEVVQVRFADGQFQVVSQGGIQSSAGFYGPGLQSMAEIAESGSAADKSILNPTKLFFNVDSGLAVTEISAGANAGAPEVIFTAPFGKAQTFTKTGAEWAVAHNFGLSPVLVQVMDSDDRVIIPDKADVSDPNTAYFYFNEVITGKVLIASGGIGAASLVPRDPFYLTVRTNDQPARPDHTLSPNADLIFDNSYFYVNVDMDTDTGGAHKKAFVSLTALAMDLPGSHGDLAGLSDNDHPQYVHTDGSNVQTGEQQGSWLVQDKIVAEAFYIKDKGEVGTDGLLNLDKLNDGGLASDERIGMAVTSDGTDIIFTITNTRDGKAASDPLDIQFNKVNFSYTPGSVELDAGGAASDTVPVLRYVYFTESAGTVSLNEASAWPSNTVHARVATVVVQTASGTQTNGVLKLHAWTDHISEPPGIEDALHGARGALHTLAERMRQEPAVWGSGVAPTVGASNTLYISTSSGTGYQLHSHNISVLDSDPGGGNDSIFVVNGNATPYATINAINELTEYADGTSIGNSDKFTVIFWIVVSENASDSKMFLNLPTGGYNTASKAIADADGKNVYTIPSHYTGTALLILELTVSRSGGGGTWTSANEKDLRGIPGTSLGGSGASNTLSDHGELSGLADDDHLQYALVSGRAGDHLSADAFYVKSAGNFSAASSGATIVSKSVVDEVEVLSGDSKNITPDFALSNTYFVALEKNTTINNPTNLPGTGLAATIQIVTEQPSDGFYSITWGNQYMFPLSQLGRRGGPNPTLAEECIDVFTFVSIPNLRQGEKLLGVASSNFY